MTETTQQPQDGSSTTTTAATSNIEQWDLTGTISPYLDRHMVFPLLEYNDTLIAADTYKYPSSDIATARLALLMPGTHMIDYAVDVYKSLHGDDATVPAEFEDQKKHVFEQLASLSEGCKTLDELCKDTEEKNKLLMNNQWNVEGLAETKSIDAKQIETYRQLARYKYDCGDYQTSLDMLTAYISLFAKAPAPAPAAPTAGENDAADEQELIAAGIAQQKQQDANKNQDLGNPTMYYLKTVDTKLLQVLWGRLACTILVEDWSSASVAIEAVKAAMETLVNKQALSAIEALQQRTWLLHWSLFVYWNDSSVKGALEQLVELFHQERYRQAITTQAPHLLRYLTAAVLLCKRRAVTKQASKDKNNVNQNTPLSNAEARRLMKNLIYVMQDCQYSDPIVEFVNCLCVKFDFQQAQLRLEECEHVLSTDFFLCHQTDLFMEEARVFVFENYCRIHNKIDLTALGEKLAMDQEQAEHWIVDLIRNADLDAKINAQESCVVMGPASGNGTNTNMSTTTANVYEQVMDRTRDLNVRSASLVQNLNGLLNDIRRERARKERAARDGEDY